MHYSHVVIALVATVLSELKCALGEEIGYYIQVCRTKGSDCISI